MRISLNLDPIGPFTDQQLYEFCMANKELCIERDASGQLYIIPYPGTETSFYNYDIGLELGIWNRKHKLGRISESNGGYILPDESMRAPDIAWISKQRLASLSLKDRQGFMRVCPDFVIELISETDTLSLAELKMENWIKNGVRLAWLIHPKKRITLVFTEDGAKKSVPFDSNLSGQEVLPRFELNLTSIFG